MAKLDAEEKEILETFEAGNLKPVARMKGELKRHQQYAAATVGRVAESDSGNGDQLDSKRR